MGKRILFGLSLLLFFALFCLPTFAAENSPQVKIAFFNFVELNPDAAGYGATIRNKLLTSLRPDSSFIIIDRKDLEQFLGLNDLQQNDDLPNAMEIGTRLALNMIIVGNVERRGMEVVVQCKVIQIEQKRAILDTRLKAFGDVNLMNELSKLADQIIKTIAVAKSGEQEDAPLQKGPIIAEKRSDNVKVYFLWDDPPGTTGTAGWEVYRAQSEGGPYTRIAQVSRSEYLDQEVQRNTIYYYKVRAFNQRGQRSHFSTVISAETAPTPNPPIILQTESHIQAVQIIWSPNPKGSEDTNPLQGYKLYRAKVEQGPYKEVANILGKDLGIGINATTTLDKIFKVHFTDKGLADGEDYFYKVTAYNIRNLESDYSRPVRGTAIPMVSSLQIRGNMIREITLSWKPVDSPFIKGYYVYRSMKPGAEFLKIKKIDGDSVKEDGRIYYTDLEGLGDKITYYYRVTAFEELERETLPSAVASTTTKGKPPVPEGMKAIGGLVKRVDLSWNVSPHEEVLGYKLYWAKEPEARYALIRKLDGRTTTAYSDKSGNIEKLDDNTSYYYRLTSFNKVDVESELTAVVSARTKPRPVKPTGLKGEALKVKSVPLEWNANPEKDINVYHVYRTEEKDGKDYVRVASAGKNGYLDQGLKDGVVYRYRVQVEDKDELLSDFSDVVTIQTKPRPKMLGGLTGDFRDDQVVLNWKPAAESDVSHYQLYEKRFFGFEKIATIKELTYRESGLAKGKSKTYAVTAVDKDGLESDISQEITITAR